MKKHLLMLGSAAALTLSAAVSTPFVGLDRADGQMLLTNRLDRPAWTQALLRPFMYDGKTQKFVYGPGKITETPTTLTFAWETPEWSFATTFRAQDKLILGESTLTNRTDRELFLEPGLAATAQFTAPATRFWDGFGTTRAIGTEKLVRNGLKGKVMPHIAAPAIPFAAAGIFSERGGIQLGHVTFDPVSYSACSYDPATRELRFSQRVAIHPKETLKLRWVAGSFDATYGGPEAAVQQHYDAFPELWTPVGGQDNPYVWGNHGHYKEWWMAPNNEFRRRYKITFDWTYCPFKRSGDILCKPDLWDYKPRNPYQGKRPRMGGVFYSFSDMSREEFLKLRRERFRKYAKKCGWMFYNTCAGTWCEIELATTKYADSLTEDPDAPILLKNWSTVHDWERRVFPMGTSFAEDFETDMKKVAEELDLPGFALDCASGGIQYRGPAVKKHLPGRSWDEKGVFIDQGVAINREVDFIHSLGPMMVAWANGPLKGDIVTYEESLVELAKLQRLMPLYKWHAGPRPTVSHGHGFEYKNMVPNWRSRTPEQFVDIISKMSDHEIFTQFQMSISQTYITMSGNPQQIYILPEAEELKRSGWNALTPMLLAPTLYAPYRSSYGKAQNSFLFLANSRPTDCAGEVKLDNELQSRRKNATILLVRKLRSQARTVNRVNGRFTAFDVELPSRVPVLFESVCVLDGAPDLTATVTTDKHLEKQSWSVTFDRCKPFTAKVTPRDIRHFKFVAMTLNGRKIEPGTAVGIKAGDKLDAQYESDIFAVSRETLDKFPFTNKERSVICRIHVPAGDEGAQAGAERFNEFFRFLGKNEYLRPQSMAPVTSNASSLNRADVIAMVTGSDRCRISTLPGGGLKVEAPDAAALEKTICRLLDELDKRYDYVIPFAPVMGLSGEMLSAAKMRGKFIPCRKYFE